MWHWLLVTSEHMPGLNSMVGKCHHRYMVMMRHTYTHHRTVVVRIVGSTSNQRNNNTEEDGENVHGWAGEGITANSIGKEQIYRQAHVGNLTGKFFHREFFS